MNPKLLAKLAMAVQWARTPQGQKTIRKAKDFLNDHEDQIKPVTRAIGKKARELGETFKETKRKFKEALKNDEGER